jgi:predicted ATPase
MKRAKVNDYWRHVYSNTYPKRLASFAFKDVRGFTDGSIDFKGGITAICGKNGVGKSTLLQCIHMLLTPDKIKISNNLSQRLRDSGTFKSDVHLIDKSVSISFTVGEQLDTSLLGSTNVHMVDPSKDVPEIITFFKTDSDIASLLAPVEAAIYDDRKLELLSYLVGTKYNSVEVFEIEDAFELGTVPYFKIKTRCAEYSSEHMGLGEFSLFYIHWLLNRIEKSSIVLLEEPESFISPNSQVALINLIAKLSDEQKLWVMLTSHSEHILDRIPNDNIYVILQGSKGSTLEKATKDASYLEQLGLRSHKKGLIFVEDSAGLMLLKLITAHFNSFINDHFNFLVSNGESKLLTLLEYITHGNHDQKVCGVFDGDVKGVIDISKSKWPAHFLPTTLPPERLIRDGIEQKPELLGKFLNQPQSIVEAKLATVEGLDHHDWILELGKSLNLTYEQIFHTGFLVWIADPNNLSVSSQFVADLEKALS